MQASNDFFAADAGNPPQRVAGPPFDTATALAAGTAANTVIWYTGEAGSDPARLTATARIDPSLAVSYGVRANEDGIARAGAEHRDARRRAGLATDPNAAALSGALNQRLTANLNGQPGAQTVTDIETESGRRAGLAQGGARTATSRPARRSAISSVRSRACRTSRSARTSCRLQTRLQASMQTTAMLFQTNLVNYLK